MISLIKIKFHNNNKLKLLDLETLLIAHHQPIIQLIVQIIVLMEIIVIAQINHLVHHLIQAVLIQHHHQPISLLQIVVLQLVTQIKQPIDKEEDYRQIQQQVLLILLILHLKPLPVS